MTKKNKTLLKTTAGISFVFGAFLAIAITLYFFDAWNLKAFVRDFLVDVMEIQTESELNFQITIMITDFLVGACLNIYAGVMYLIYAKAQLIYIGASRSILYIGLLQILFGVSIIPGVMAVIVGARIKNGDSQTIDQLKKTQSDMDILTEKINFIKQQKEAGVITEEQYSTMLNKYIEEEANNKAKK